GVEKEQVDAVIEAISASAKSEGEGSVGDGKIFVNNLEKVVRIRTGETGSTAL
ncbi:MAG: P-II family nitrogen regulator, partial [Candidatus Thioglobus sp.]|nr:P-II family nitrogen regulator [Candidatus Thioglobus sp.]